MRHSFCVVKVCCRDGDFTFHLVLTEEGRAVKMRAGGWWGRPDTNDIQPFILKPDGKIDFGVAPEDDLEYELKERFGKTDLLERGIFIGREVTVDVDREHYQLKVDAIEEIVGSGARAHFPA